MVAIADDAPFTARCTTRMLADAEIGRWRRYAQQAAEQVVQRFPPGTSDATSFRPRERGAAPRRITAVREDKKASRVALPASRAMPQKHAEARRHIYRGDSAIISYSPPLERHCSFLAMPIEANTLLFHDFIRREYFRFLLSRCDDAISAIRLRLAAQSTRDASGIFIGYNIAGQKAFGTPRRDFIRQVSRAFYFCEKMKPLLAPRIDAIFCLYAFAFSCPTLAFFSQPHCHFARPLI